MQQSHELIEEMISDMPAGVPAIWTTVGSTVRLYLRAGLDSLQVEHLRAAALADAGPQTGSAVA